MSVGDEHADAAARAADRRPWSDGLDAAQREAAAYDGGPLIVLAGPGAGKTRLIVHRVARLLAPEPEGGAGAEPESIVCLAFNIRAAAELRERILGLCGRAGERVVVRTSHAFARSLVRRFGDAIGLPAEPVIMDSAQRRRIARRLIREHGLYPDYESRGRDPVIDDAVKWIDACRHGAVEPDEAARRVEERAARLDRNEDGLDEDGVAAERERLALHRQHARLYALDAAARLDEGLITIDDYIWFARRVLREREGAAAIVRDEHRHLVIDEFQDWNRAQIDLLGLLAPPARAGRPALDVCVVGDDDQSIYTFRGADDRAFERFREMHGDVRTILLETNYRSAPPIIAAANDVIRRADHRFAPDKVIRPNPARAPAPGERVEAVIVPKDRDTGATLAAMLMAAKAEAPDRPWSEYAVLARTVGFADEIADELALHGVPAAVPPRAAHYDDLAVQDALAWLRAVVDPDDWRSLKRLLLRPPIAADMPLLDRLEVQRTEARRAGDTRPAAEWLAAAAMHEPPVERLLALLDAFRRRAVLSPADEVLEEVIRTAGLAGAEGLPPRERAARIRALAALVRFGRTRRPRLGSPPDVRALLAYLDDLDDKERQALDSAGEDRVEGGPDDAAWGADAVRILTAHGAKGLEFDTVFVVRVRPGHGYPLSERSDSVAPPAWLTGAVEDARADEERRVFYVACTRAERRLVLLAQDKQSKKTPPTDYILELTGDGATAPVARSAASEWVERAGLALPSDTGQDDEPGSTWLDRESAAARRAAAAALFEADRPGLSADALGAIDRRLADAAARIATLASLRAGSPPAFLDRAAAGHAPLVRLVERHEQGDAAAPNLGLRPPLKISFSQVTLYRDCPGCYYCSNVLGVPEPFSAALNLGSVAHVALERWARDAQEADAEGRPRKPVEWLQDAGVRALHATAPPGQPIEERDTERLRAMLAHAHAMHTGTEGDNIIHVERAFDFPYALDGHTHRITGRIDLITQAPGGGWRIVDYKTGSPVKRLTSPEKGDLQLAMYAMALPRILDAASEDLADRPPDTCPEEGAAEYWLLSTGERGAIALQGLKLEKAMKEIDEAIRGLLAGRFDSAGARKCRGLCRLLGA